MPLLLAHLAQPFFHKKAIADVSAPSPRCAIPELPASNKSGLRTENEFSTSMLSLTIGIEKRSRKRSKAALACPN